MESETIAWISVVTDTETAQEKIGDVFGGFDDLKLEKHIRHHGTQGLLNTIMRMNCQIGEITKLINKEEQKAQDALSGHVDNATQIK